MRRVDCCVAVFREFGEPDLEGLLDCPLRLRTLQSSEQKRVAAESVVYVQLDRRGGPFQREEQGRLTVNLQKAFSERAQLRLRRKAFLVPLRDGEDEARFLSALTCLCSLRLRRWIESWLPTTRRLPSGR